eukprot:m.6379 g.6379  ORF g.6379 m.6379 type:complete len:60 (-) comp5149_c0_seq1:527-706(-)
MVSCVVSEGFLAYFSVSAKTGEGLDEAIACLAEKLGSTEKDSGSDHLKLNEEPKEDSCC